MFVVKYFVRKNRGYSDDYFRKRKRKKKAAVGSEILDYLKFLGSQ